MRSKVIQSLNWLKATSSNSIFNPNRNHYRAIVVGLLMLQIGIVAIVWYVNRRA